MLFIVRHAWAEDRGEAYPSDEERPLTKAGRKRFRKVVKRLAKRGFEPAQLATSPLLRCRETADIIAEQCPGGPAITVLDALAPGSSLESALEWTKKQTGDVAWIGHAPDVEQLTAALIGDGSGSLRFAKGAVAAIEFDGETAPGAGRLCWLATAEILNC